MTRTRAQVALLLASVLLCSSHALAEGTQPTPQEQEALAQLKGRIAGQIVWESNRTGAWELYTMNADGTGVRQLTKLANAGDQRAFNGYLRPRISPDGETVLFGYGQRGAPVESWIVSATGGEARKLAVGVPLNWAADSRSLFFFRESAVYRCEVDTGQETLIHEVNLPASERDQGMVGTLRQDQKAVILRTPKTNEYYVFDQGKTVKAMGGCECRLSWDGRYAYWVQGPKDFRVWDIQQDEEHQLLGQPPVEPYNYTYFPTVTNDNGWLLYGASPGQHSHDTSDYEVYLQRLRDWQPAGQPVRLTFNDRTDRWPYLHVGENRFAEANYDTPAPIDPDAPVTVLSFATEDATPEIGGQWGLWPQNEVCRGDATFVAGDDAEGNAGGSVRIEYGIEGEPQSVALWISPAGGTLDLSRFDRLVLYAKGDVPTFTVVAEDGSAEEAGGSKGVSDLIVEGVTGEWQRLVLPLRDFRPRERGGEADWTRINVLAIALIAPRSPRNGVLHIDNIRLLPAKAG